ncbi:MAG: hypothetical protein AAGA08_16775 [Pseudomonadota bacterium]
MKSRVANLAALVLWSLGAAQAECAQISALAPTLTVRTLADYSRFSSIALEQVGTDIIHEWSASGEDILLSRDEVNTLVRRRFPGLTNFWGSASPKCVSVHVDQNQFDGSQGERIDQFKCRQLDTAVEQNQFVTLEQTSQVPCRKDIQDPGLFYDRSTGLSKSRKPLGAGTYLGPVVLNSTPFALRDDPLLVSVQLGPIQIERNVRAVMPVQDHSYTHVRDFDGNILTVPSSSISAPKIQP